MKTILRLLWNGFLLITCGILIAAAYLCKILDGIFTKMRIWLAEAGDKIYAKIYNNAAEVAPVMDEDVDT